MRREVESLLAESASDDGFLAKPLLSMSPYAVTAIGRAAMAGTALGGYQLHTLLGVSGMGEVYQAHEMFVDGGPPVRLVTGETRRLTDLTDRSSPNTFDATLDGKHPVFDRTQQNSDIVLIDRPRK